MWNVDELWAQKVLAEGTAAALQARLQVGCLETGILATRGYLSEVSLSLCMCGHWQIQPNLFIKRDATSDLCWILRIPLKTPLPQATNPLQSL